MNLESSYLVQKGKDWCSYIHETEFQFELMYTLFFSTNNRKELAVSSIFSNQHARIFEPTTFWFLCLSKLSLAILRTYKLLTYFNLLCVKKQHVHATMVASTLHTQSCFSNWKRVSTCSKDSEKNHRRLSIDLHDPSALTCWTWYH